MPTCPQTGRAAAGRRRLQVADRNRCSAAAIMFDELPGADRYDVEEEIGHGTFSEASGWVAAASCKALALPAAAHPPLAPLIGYPLGRCPCRRCTARATGAAAAWWP